MAPQQPSRVTNGPLPSAACLHWKGDRRARHPPLEDRRTGARADDARIPHRHDPRLPAHRPAPRAEEGRRGVLGRQDLTADLEATTKELRAATRERLASLGLGRTDSSIPRAFSFYDQVLDAAVTVGAVPTASSGVGERRQVDLAGYFTIARGEGRTRPAEMTKWFDTNYHYLVPEIGPETALHLASRPRSSRVRSRRRPTGFVTRPVIVGPVTFLLLSKPSEGAPEGFAPLDRLDDLARRCTPSCSPSLRAAGAEWVQLDEPALVSESIEVPRATVLAAAAGARTQRSAARPTAPASSSRRRTRASTTRCRCCSPPRSRRSALDLVRGAVPTSVPRPDKVLVGGVIDGHNIWRGDLDAAFEQARGAAGALAERRGRRPRLPVPRAARRRRRADCSSDS